MTKHREALTYRSARRNEARRIRGSTKVRETDGRERRMTFPEAWFLAQKNHGERTKKKGVDRRERKS